MLSATDKSRIKLLKLWSRLESKAAAALELTSSKTSLELRNHYHT